MSLEQAVRKLSFESIRRQTTTKLNRESEAVQVIKERLEQRKKLNKKNDWKIKFYEDKLKAKERIIQHLRSLMS